MESGYHQTVSAEKNELDGDQAKFDRERDDESKLAKAADGMDVDDLKSQVNGVNEKAGTATHMAKDFASGVHNAEHEEEVIEGALGVAGHDVHDLQNDRASFHTEIKNLQKEEDAFRDDRVGSMKAKIQEGENKINAKILHMRTQAGPSIDLQMQKLSESDRQKGQELRSLNKGVDTERQVMENKKDKSCAASTKASTLKGKSW